MAMSFLSDANLIVVVIATTVVTVGRAWISLRKAYWREKAVTDRFVKAIEGSSPQQRPAIIRAVGALDERPADRAESEEEGADDPPDALEKWSLFAWLRRLGRNPESTKDS